MHCRHMLSYCNSSKSLGYGNFLFSAVDHNPCVSWKVQTNASSYRLAQNQLRSYPSLSYQQYSTILYCIVLYCTVLYCTVLYCTVLYYFVLLCSEE